MPRFVLMEVYKPPLSSKKIYKESEDQYNLLCGYGKQHNIILYDSVDFYINKTIKDVKTIADALVNIKIEREEYNTRAIYYYLKKRIKESKIYKNSPLTLPKYDDIKDVLYRKVYDKITERYLYTTDSFYLNNSPKNKEEFENTISRLYIGGEEIEIKTPIEDIVKYLKGYYGKMPLINKVVRSYYAMCMDTIFIEDNYLNIAPWEMSRFFHDKDTIVDKFYKVKALEAIGLTEEIPSRWIEGRSILTIIVREDEQHEEEYLYPPDSTNYGLSGMYGDDEFGNDYE